MKLHTTPKRVENQLNTSCSFSDSTIPSINAVNEWIREVSSELNELTEHKYNRDEQVDILDWSGRTMSLLTSRAPISDVVVYYNNANSRSAPNWVQLEEFFNYIVDTTKGRITLQEGSGAGYTPGHTKFKIQYISGTEDTPYWLQNIATRMVTREVISATLNARANSKEGSQIRVGAVSVINPSDYGVSNFRELKEGIEKDLEGLRNQSRGIRYVNYKQH